MNQTPLTIPIKGNVPHLFDGKNTVLTLTHPQARDLFGFLSALRQMYDLEPSTSPTDDKKVTLSGLGDMFISAFHNARAERLASEISEVEDMFVTTDRATNGNVLTFNLTESEDGSTYWGYGHVEPDTFTAEVNRWLVHTMEVTDPDDLIQVGTPVEWIWARQDSDSDERFDIVDMTGPYELKAGQHIFPVTRLVL